MRTCEDSSGTKIVEEAKAIASELPAAPTAYAGGGRRTESGAASAPTRPHETAIYDRNRSKCGRSFEPLRGTSEADPPDDPHLARAELLVGREAFGAHRLQILPHVDRNRGEQANGDAHTDHRTHARRGRVSARRAAVVLAS
jgi:hypothetical protein